MKIGNQEIYFKSAETMDDLDSETITLIVTSPPYWNVRDYKPANGEQIGFGQTYDEYIASLNAVWSECLRVLQPNGKIAINVQPLPIPRDKSGFNFRVIYNIMYDIEAFFRKNDCFLSGMIYWDKAPYINNVSWGSYPKPSNIATNTSFEQIFTFVKRGSTRELDPKRTERSLLNKHEWRHWAVRCIWDDVAPVIKINSKGENLFGHGAPFPEEIPYRLIRMHTIEGETVLDPFTGSGTTLKMCEFTNRKGIGYEINKDFEPLIRDRIQGDWTAQGIESHYKTVGNKSMAMILKKAYEILKNDLSFEDDERNLKNVIKGLKKGVPDIFSSAFAKNVKKNL